MTIDELNGVRQLNRRLEELLSQLKGLLCVQELFGKTRRLSFLIAEKKSASEKLSAEILAAQQELQEKIRRAGLKFLEREVLIFRYVFCWKFWQIIEELNYSRPHIYRLHKSGVDKLSAR